MVSIAKSKEGDVDILGGKVVASHEIAVVPATATGWRRRRMLSTLCLHKLRVLGSKNGEVGRGLLTRRWMRYRKHEGRE